MPRRRPFWQDPEEMPVPSGRMLLVGLAGVTMCEGRETKTFWALRCLQIHPSWQLFQALSKIMAVLDFKHKKASGLSLPLI